MDPSITASPVSLPPAFARPGETQQRSARQRSSWDGYWKGAVTVVIVMYAFITLRAHDLAPFIGKLRPSLLTMIVGLFLLYTRSGPRVRKTALRDRSVRWTGYYVVWVALTIPSALWPAEAFQWFRVVLVGATVLVACAFVRPSRVEALRLHKAMVWGGGLVAVAALIKNETEYGRLLWGSLYDPNDFGALIGSLIILGFGLFLRTRGKDKLITLVALAPMGVAMLATGSRGVLVGFGIGMLALVLGYRGKRLATVVVGLVVGIIAAGTQVDADVRDRLTSVFALEKDYNFTDDSGRMAIWGRGLQYIQDRPILGAGAGNFPMADGHYFEMLGQPGKWKAAHNTFVQAGVELGLPGLFILLVLYWTALKRSVRYWRPRKWMRACDGHTPEIFACFVAYAVSAFFLSHAFMVIQFFLMGLILVNDRSLMAFRAEATKRTRNTNRTASFGPLPNA